MHEYAGLHELTPDANAVITLLKHDALEFAVAVTQVVGAEVASTKKRAVALLGLTTTGKTALLEMISEVVQSHWLEVREDMLCDGQEREQHFSKPNVGVINEWDWKTQCEGRLLPDTKGLLEGKGTARRG